MCICVSYEHGALWPIVWPIGTPCTAGHCDRLHTQHKLVGLWNSAPAASSPKALCCQKARLVSRWKKYSHKICLDPPAFNILDQPITLKSLNPTKLKFGTTPPKKIGPIHFSNGWACLGFMIKYNQSDKNSGKIVEAQKRKQIAFMCCIYVYIFFTKNGQKKTQSI